MEKLIELMKKDFSELNNTRKIQRALDLSRQNNVHFNHNEYPMYFTGNPKSKLVMVQLNQKQADNFAETYTGELKFENFDEYFNFYRFFGKHHYGETTPRTHKSYFDPKVIRFLKPFNVINFDDTKDKFYNLEKVVDDKFQLELVPYGSNKFNTSSINTELLKPYIDILLDTITAEKREYILFCGKIFEKVLSDYIQEKKDFEFKLLKNDGAVAKNTSKFSKITLRFNDKTFQAGVAQSFAQQGINMVEYGKKCHELYNS